MSIFHINSKGAKQIKNISKGKMTKFYNVKDTQVRVDFLDASFGELDGKRILLDESATTQATKQLLKAFSINETKYNPFPAHIIISNKMLENNQFEEISSMSNFVLSTAEPRYSLDEIYLPDKTKKQIMTALSIQKHNDKLRNQWGLATTLKDGRAVILNFSAHRVPEKASLLKQSLTILAKE